MQRQGVTASSNSSFCLKSNTTTYCACLINFLFQYKSVRKVIADLCASNRPRHLGGCSVVWKDRFQPWVLKSHHSLPKSKQGYNSQTFQQYLRRHCYSAVSRERYPSSHQFGHKDRNWEHMNIKHWQHASDKELSYSHCQVKSLKDKQMNKSLVVSFRPQVLLQDSDCKFRLCQGYRCYSLLCCRHYSP